MTNVNIRDIIRNEQSDESRRRLIAVVNVGTSVWNTVSTGTFRYLHRQYMDLRQNILDQMDEDIK